MQKLIEPQVFDWSRGKTAGIRDRGTAALIMPQLKLSSGASSLKTKPRCIWPSAIQNGDSRYLSRRVWGR